MTVPVVSCLVYSTAVIFLICAMINAAVTPLSVAVFYGLPCLPGVAYGVYLLVLLFHALLTFKSYPSEEALLLKDIQHARCLLKARGFHVD